MAGEGRPVDRDASGPGSRPSNTEELLPESSSVDLEMQQAGGSRADLLSHRHPHHAAANGANGTAGGDAAADKPQQERADSSKELQPSEAGEPSEPEVVIKPASYWDIAKHFGLLGWTAFGGPAAHISMFLAVSGALGRKGARLGLSVYC
jgi:hypothetical protein